MCTFALAEGPGGAARNVRATAAAVRPGAAHRVPVDWVGTHRNTR